MSDDMVNDMGNVLYINSRRSLASYTCDDIQRVLNNNMSPLIAYHLFRKYLMSAGNTFNYAILRTVLHDYLENKYPFRYRSKNIESERANRLRRITFVLRNLT